MLLVFLIFLKMSEMLGSNRYGKANVRFRSVNE
jgi:hypothetical protein